MNIQYRRDLWKVITVPGNSCEIGVAEGYFSADILSWKIHFPRHFMVDRWRCVPTQKGDAGNPQAWHDKNLADARARVAQFGERAVFLQGDSVEMSRQVPDNSLAFLYIDSDHSFEGVLLDIFYWIPKLVKGGVIAFHDFENPAYGVKKAVTSFADANNLTLSLLPEDKMEDAGAWIIIP